eukprot:scaffold13430_cov103-Isochrysis_galbana.AAC.1
MKEFGLAAPAYSTCSLHTLLFTPLSAAGAASILVPAAAPRSPFTPSRSHVPRRYFCSRPCCSATCSLHTLPATCSLHTLPFTRSQALLLFSSLLQRHVLPSHPPVHTFPGATSVLAPAAAPRAPFTPSRSH